MVLSSRSNGGLVEQSCLNDPRDSIEVRGVESGVDLGLDLALELALERPDRLPLLNSHLKRTSLNHKLGLVRAETSDGSREL